MTPIDATIFIGAVIAGITEAIRALSAKVNGAVTVGVATITGFVISLVDVQLGVQNISPAQGIMIGLGTAGIVGAVKKIG